MANRARSNPESRIPAMPSPRLVLVVPCFNEAGRLHPEAFLGFAASRPAVRPDVDIILGSRVALMGRDVRRETWCHCIGRAV